MALIFKLALVALVHIVFFAAYPDTGPYGNYYLAVSLVLWTGFTLFLGTAVKLVKFFSGAIGAVLNLAILALMTGAIAFTMPQSDKTSVLEKLQKGSYPDRATINKGMKRFGVNLEKEMGKGAKELEEKAKEAAKKL
ncbi:MAG TPA: hypothetical protein DCZ92_15125 [Elusimicrobia bacterium]|nr:MAG: hypothetical protein A2016_03285 [Elusimicrobia bacterium GWF2_62_30]HBA62113.1 hypothetical protein [Elusimicrobiota bacterium]